MDVAEILIKLVLSRFRPLQAISRPHDFTDFEPGQRFFYRNRSQMSCLWCERDVGRPPSRSTQSPRSPWVPVQGAGDLRHTQAGAAASSKQYDRRQVPIPTSPLQPLISTSLPHPAPLTAQKSIKIMCQFYPSRASKNSWKYEYSKRSV